MYKIKYNIFTYIYNTLWNKTKQTKSWFKVAIIISKIYKIWRENMDWFSCIRSWRRLVWVQMAFQCDEMPQMSKVRKRVGMPCVISSHSHPSIIESCHKLISGRVEFLHAHKLFLQKNCNFFRPLNSDGQRSNCKQTICQIRTCSWIFQKHHQEKEKKSSSPLANFYFPVRIKIRTYILWIVIKTHFAERELENGNVIFTLFQLASTTQYS